MHLPNKHQKVTCGCLTPCWALGIQRWTESELLTSRGSQSSRDKASKQIMTILGSLWASQPRMSPWNIRDLVTNDKDKSQRAPELGSQLFWDLSWFPPGALCSPVNCAAAWPPRAPWGGIPVPLCYVPSIENLPQRAPVPPGTPGAWPNTFAHLGLSSIVFININPKC